METVLPWVYGLAWAFSVVPIVRLARRHGRAKWAPLAVIAAFLVGAALTVVTTWALG